MLAAPEVSGPCPGEPGGPGAPPVATLSRPAPAPAGATALGGGAGGAAAPLRIDFAEPSPSTGSGTTTSGTGPAAAEGAGCEASGVCGCDFPAFDPMHAGPPAADDEPLFLPPGGAAPPPPPADLATAEHLYLDHQLLLHAPPLPSLVCQVPIIGDLWHGQLVWWNRLVANRKKNRGLACGYHLGRAVDLDCEWLPTFNLFGTKMRLRAQAAAAGRRSVYCQSLDDMRYMIIPPRAVSPYPDMNAARQVVLRSVARQHSLACFQGLLRGELILQLRAITGMPNSKLEIQLLDTFMRMQTRVCTNPGLADINELRRTTVWNILSANINLRSMPQKAAYESPAELAEASVQTQSSTDPHSMPPPVAWEMKKNSGHYHPKKRSRDGLSVSDDSLLRQMRLGNDGLFVMRRKRGRRTKLEASLVDTGMVALLDEHEWQKGQSESTAIALSPRSQVKLMQQQYRIVHLCRSLHVSREELVDLLRSVPVTILNSPTGRPFPRIHPDDCFALIDRFLGNRLGSSSSSSSRGWNQAERLRRELVALHYCAANLFVYRLFRACAFTVRVSGASKEGSRGPQSHEYEYVLALGHMHATLGPYKAGATLVASAYQAREQRTSPDSAKQAPEMVLAGHRKLRRITLKIMAASAPHPREATEVGDGERTALYAIHFPQLSDRPLPKEALQRVLAATRAGDAETPADGTPPFFQLPDLERRLRSLDALRKMARRLRELFATQIAVLNDLVDEDPDLSPATLRNGEELVGDWRALHARLDDEDPPPAA